MISTAGATTIAVIIPVGLLVLVVELRRTLLEIAIGLKWLIPRSIAVVVLFVASLGSLTAELICVIYVSSNQTIRGWVAVVVYVSAFTLAVVVGSAVSYTVGKMTALILRRASDEEIRALDEGSSTTR